MNTVTRITRFTVIDRITHLGLILTFSLLSITGAGRLYFNTDWGTAILSWFGGYTSATIIHIWAGWLMTLGFIVHILLVLTRLDWRSWKLSLFGPDSLIPTARDFREFGQRVLWFFGIGNAPKFERWTYWEKFDYWAVFWGIPLLFITGLMLIYPIETSRFLPGWTLNIALLLHRAEAILAISYIIVIHLLVGHFRRSTFPLNETMFSGSVSVEEEAKEKADWIERLSKTGQMQQLKAEPPVTWYRRLYFVFGYAVIASGFYFIGAAIYYSQFIVLH